MHVTWVIIFYVIRLERTKIATFKMWILSWIFLLLSSSFALLLFLWKRNVSKFPKIECGPCIPILGWIPFVESEPTNYRKQLITFSQKYNYLYVLWATFIPVLQVGCVEYVEPLLNSTEHITKSFFYKFHQPWLGTGLVLSTGKKWKTRRKQITPSFHFSILNEFQNVIMKQAKVLVEKLKKCADGNEEIDIQSTVSLTMLDIICETAMGVSIDAQMNANSQYVSAIHKVNTQIEKRAKTPWYWPDFIYPYTTSGKEFFKNLKIIHHFTSEVIKNRIFMKQYEGNVSEANRSSSAFLDMLIDLYTKGEIDEEGIQEEVDTFMFEGHDTTSSGLSWTLYCLGKYPDIQRKLRAEIDTISDDDDNCLVEKIKALKYLEYVIKEAIRLYPPVPMIGRKLMRDTIIEGHTFPAGMEFFVHMFALHTNPAYWDDPFEFQPERFSEERSCKRHPFCYVPFSAGPRNCIGQKFAMLEEKIVLFLIIRNFELHLSGKDIIPVFEVVQRSENGIFMKVQRK